MTAALHVRIAADFGGAVGQPALRRPATFLLDHHEHTRRCWWVHHAAHWACSRRADAPQ